MVLFTVLSSLFEATMCQLNFLIEAGQGNPPQLLLLVFIMPRAELPRYTVIVLSVCHSVLPG